MFSGLYESIRSSNWEPSGIPTIVKLAEQITAKAPLYWFIICKTEKESSVVGNKLRQITFENGITAHIIPYRNFMKSVRTNVLINNAFAIIYLFKTLKRLKDKLFYCDRSNILIAALIKILYGGPVVIRILGLYPDQKALASRRLFRLLNPMTYLAYKRKYDLAICTEDGSGVAFYIDNILNRDTRRLILLNGVDKLTDRPRKKNHSGDIVFLFVGAMTDQKGILELIEAFSKLKKHNYPFRLKIVGKGELASKVVSLIRERDIERHTEMVGAVSLKRINEVYLKSDVYISLNKLGSLSNTVLEAMAAGKCIVMLDKDEETHTDESTGKLVPNDVVIRIDRNNIVDDLTQKLADLIENPAKITVYSERMTSFADKFLWSWDERISYEISLLEKIAEGEAVK